MRKIVALCIIVAAFTTGYQVLGSPVPDPGPVLNPYLGLLPHLTPPDPNWYKPSDVPPIPRQDQITTQVPQLPKNYGVPGIHDPDQGEIQRMVPNPNDAFPWLERPNHVPSPQDPLKEIPDKNWYLPSTPRIPKSQDVPKMLPDPNWYKPSLPRFYVVRTGESLDA